MIKKMISELVGTMLLVLFGCGTAIAVNAYVTSVFNTAFAFTMLIIALAFGLVLYYWKSIRMSCKSCSNYCNVNR